MTALGDVRAAAARLGLGVVGACSTNQSSDDAVLPDGIETLVLLGATGPEMWEAFQQGPEALDTAPHPMDRWSRRVIGSLADGLGAQAFFPFDGPPWHPFQKWAVWAEGATPSPMLMLVTPGRGLWTSYRGALGFRERIEVPAVSGGSPCTPCPAPCKTACPVDAFEGGHYDTTKCAAHVRSDEGVACREGCLVRRSCPAGAGLELSVQQRAFHMQAFLRAHPELSPG